jgi:hypothetical protein
MMRIAKDVEEELKEDDDEVGRYGSKKGCRNDLDEMIGLGRCFGAGAGLTRKKQTNPTRVKKLDLLGQT